MYIISIDFVKEELKRLLGQSKARADVASENGCDYDRVRHRNWLSSINSDSGAWLSAGVSPKMFGTSNSDFVSATCRRSAVEDLTTPKCTALMSRENPHLFYCACDGGLRVDAIVEPMRLFAGAAEDASNQRPDAFLRSPRGLGRQAIVDVAVTGVDGQSRASDEARS